MSHALAFPSRPDFAVQVLWRPAPLFLQFFSSEVHRDQRDLFTKTPDIQNRASFQMFFFFFKFSYKPVELGEL